MLFCRMSPGHILMKWVEKGEVLANAIPSVLRLLAFLRCPQEGQTFRLV